EVGDARYEAARRGGAPGRQDDHARAGGRRVPVPLLKHDEHRLEPRPIDRVDDAEHRPFGAAAEQFGEHEPYPDRSSRLGHAAVDSTVHTLDPLQLANLSIAFDTIY